MELQNLLSRSKNTEVNAVTERISTNFHQNLGNDPNLSPLFAAIDAKNLTLTLSVKRMKTESDLEEKDNLRDAAHHALYYFISGLTFSKNAAVKNAASNLFAILSRYGLAITENSYDVESSELDSLLLELTVPDLQPSVDTLDSCAGLLADLQSAQDAFKAARLAFQREQAAESQQNNASSLKQEVLALVNKKLIPVLKGLLVTHPADYTEFGTTVAQIIATNNETVKLRKTTKAGNSEAE